MSTQHTQVQQFNGAAPQRSLKRRQTCAGSSVRLSATLGLVALGSLSLTAHADYFDPAPIELGGINLYPLLKLDQHYDDNLFLQSNNEQSSWVTIVTPEIKALALQGANRYQLDYKAEGGSFDNSSADNYVDQKASADIHWEPSSHHRFDLGGYYQRDHDRRGTEYNEGQSALKIDEPDRWERSSAYGRYILGSDGSTGRLEFGVDGYDKTFLNHREDTRSRDRRGVEGDAAFFLRLSGKTHALLEVSHELTDYKEDPATVIGAKDVLDSTTTKYLAGITWKFAGKTSGTIKAGRETKDFDDEDREDFTGTSWSADLNWNPKSYSRFKLSGGRRTEESNGRGDFISATDWALSWRHGWTERFESKISYEFSNEVYENDPEGRADDITSVALRFDYAMRRWLSVGIFGEHIQRDSSLAEFTYDRNLGGLQLKASL